MPPKSTHTVTPTAAGCRPQRGARAHSDQSGEERTAGLERGPNSKESDLEVHQRASLSEDEAVETTDPEAMTTEDLRRQVEEAEREAECRDLMARFHRAKATLARSKRDHTGQIRTQPGIHPLGQAAATYVATPGGPYVLRTYPRRHDQPNTVNRADGKGCQDASRLGKEAEGFRSGRVPHVLSVLPLGRESRRSRCSRCSLLAERAGGAGALGAPSWRREQEEQVLSVLPLGGESRRSRCSRCSLLAERAERAGPNCMTDGKV
jgi:hypothetical protein